MIESERINEWMSSSTEKKNNCDSSMLLIFLKYSTTQLYWFELKLGKPHFTLCVSILFIWFLVQLWNISSTWNLYEFFLRNCKIPRNSIGNFVWNNFSVRSFHYEIYVIVVLNNDMHFPLCKIISPRKLWMSCWQIRETWEWNFNHVFAHISIM